MGYHIFLVGEENFKICVERGVYGLVEPDSEKSKAEVISAAFTIKPDDFVFFYVKNTGIYGLWKVTSHPFYDNSRIWPDEKQKYPYRFYFDPTVRKFPNPIALSDILDLRDKGTIWTFDLGTIARKNHFGITADEGKEIIRLLLRNNPIFYPVDKTAKKRSSSVVSFIPLVLKTGEKDRIEYEGILNAWFMKSFAEGRLKELVGDYKDFLNYVPTSFNKVMDIFLTHVTSIDSVEILHKFTCIEIKTDLVTEEDLRQVIRYENWLIRKLAGGDSEMVQSILVGHDFEPSVLEYREKRRLIDEKIVRLIKYRVSESKDDILLTEV